jgi:hypothetical protein
MDADEVVVHIMKGDRYLLSTRGAKNGLNGLLPRVTCALSFLLRAFQVKRHLAVKRPILPNTGGSYPKSVISARQATAASRNSDR